jgi:succinate dehydrogenase hydrophobic anchor subunit
MQGQILEASPSAAATSSRSLISWRAVLWGALLTYPLVPAMLYQSRVLAEANPLAGGFCLLISYAWGVSGPAAAWLALCAADRAKINRREQPQLAREAILAALGAPFFVLTGAVLAWFRLTGYQDAVWYALLAVVAAARFLPAPEPRTSSLAALARFHRLSAVLLLLFGMAHVANHLAAVESLHAHVAAQNALRVIYRQPVVESLIVIAALSQVWTGWTLVSRAHLQRSDRLRNLQILAGAFLGMFFVSHLTGVFISGRAIQHVDTTFAWATGGPQGLLSNPRSPQFIPYYSLAVLALFLHAAYAGRWALVPMLGERGALKLCYGVIAAGISITLLLLFPMSGFHLR